MIAIATLCAILGGISYGCGTVTQHARSYADCLLRLDEMRLYPPDGREIVAGACVREG